MPSVSKQQQKFMGIVRAIQKGDVPASKFSKKAQDAAKKMKQKDVEKYAKTKHKNLPSKVRQEIEEYVDGILDGVGKEFMTKEGKVDEGKWSKIMKAVRKGPKAGPWTFIISKNNKIKKQVSVKNIKEIPAYYEDLKKAYPNDKIGIEAKDGKIVYRESVNEGSCGYGMNGQLGNEPAGPHLLKKKKNEAEKWKTVGIDVRDIYDYMVSIKKTNPAKFKKDMKNKALKGIWDRYSKGGKMYKEESVNEKIKLKGKSGMGAISHVGMPKASKGVEKLFKIADTGFGKVGGQTVDSMSANLFKQIYNKANDDIKKKLNTKSEKQLIMILAKMWDKFGKNVKIGSSL